MYVFYMYCIWTRTHEDMLFYRGGVCDTLGNSGFSGELVSFEELGQPDLIKLL